MLIHYSMSVKGHRLVNHRVAKWRQSTLVVLRGAVPHLLAPIPFPLLPPINADFERMITDNYLASNDT